MLDMRHWGTYEATEVGNRKRRVKGCIHRIRKRRLKRMESLGKMERGLGQ